MTPEVIGNSVHRMLNLFSRVLDSMSGAAVINGEPAVDVTPDAAAFYLDAEQAPFWRDHQEVELVFPRAMSPEAWQGKAPSMEYNPVARQGIGEAVEHAAL